jgi:hypothetical protein
MRPWQSVPANREAANRSPGQSDIRIRAIFAASSEEQPAEFLAIAKAPRWPTERSPRAGSEASIKAARATSNRQRSGYQQTPIAEFPSIFQAPEQISEARAKLHNVLI